MMTLLSTTQQHNNMKPTRHTQERVVEVGSQSAVGQTRTAAPASQHASKASQTKAFAGKVFYLDLPSNKKAEVLENDIKQLGGIVEKFFSKEIKYLVSNKREAKYVHCLRRDLPSLSGPSSGHSSPLPRPGPQPAASQRDPLQGQRDPLQGQRDPLQAQSDAVVTSRGRALVEKVVKKEQERIQMNKVLTNALEWGVKILYIDDVLTYVEKKKKSQSTVSTGVVQNVARVQSSARPAFQKCKGGRIARPFVKVEDGSRHYRPVYLTLSALPELNLRTSAPCTPFCPQDRKPREHGAETSEERGHARAKRNRDKKKAGYCECCLLKYDNLATHLQGERHKAFSMSDDEYLVLDRLVSTLDCNFRTTTPIHTKTSRSKVGESPVPLPPGTHVKAERRPGPADAAGGLQRHLQDARGGGLSTGKRRSVPVRHRDPNHSGLDSRTTTHILAKTSRSEARVPDVLPLPSGPESPSGGHRPAEGQPSEGQPSEGQPSEGQPSEGQPSAVTAERGSFRIGPENPPPSSSSNALCLKRRLAPRRKRPRRSDRPTGTAALAPGAPPLLLPESEPPPPSPRAETAPSRVERSTFAVVVLPGDSRRSCATEPADEKAANTGDDVMGDNAPYRVPANSPASLASSARGPPRGRDDRAGDECPATPVRKVRRKECSRRRKRRKVESPWTAVGERMRTRTSPKEAGLDIPEAVLTLWHLFQSSEDADPDAEFRGFGD